LQETQEILLTEIDSHLTEKNTTNISTIIFKVDSIYAILSKSYSVLKVAV